MKKWLVVIVALAGCNSSKQDAKTIVPKPIPAMVSWEAESPLLPLPKPPLGVPGDFSKLSFTVTPEKVRLGRWLFFDKRLSKDMTISCASCHRPDNAFSEPTAHSTGVGGAQGARKSPTFVNGAWPLFPVYFWDGRAKSLLDQAKGPIENPIEMAMTHAAVVDRISKVPAYKVFFAEVFKTSEITIAHIAEAIAAYEATRMSGSSPYDRFDAGDTKAMTAEQQLGRELFFGKARCNQCHFGWNFSDSQFHNVGIGWNAAKAKGKRGLAAQVGLADIGRFKISKKPTDVGAFKTPTVRDVSKHAPYMHDGSLATLKDVVHHYNQGGKRNPWLSKKINRLKLTEKQENAIVAFLHALDGFGYQDEAPRHFPQ